MVRVYVWLMFCDVIWICGSKETVSYQIHLPVGQLINLPCDPILIGSNPDPLLPYSAAEWFDIGGFYIHSGFVLPIRAVSEKLLHGVVCNLWDQSGEVSRTVEHRILVYVRPVIMWAFTVSLKGSLWLSGGSLSKIQERRFLALSDRLDVLCEENSACFYQFMFVHKSTFQKYVLENDGSSSRDQDSSVQVEMDALDADSVPVTFYFKVGFSEYRVLKMDPHSLQYKAHVQESQAQFRTLLEESALDVFIDRSLFLDGRRTLEMRTELICPSGSQEVVGVVACEQCVPGYFARPGGQCQPCEYGYFQGRPGSSHCDPCPDLYTTADRATTREDLCLFDGPLWTSSFVSMSRTVWTNLVTSYRTFSVSFVLVSFIYFLVSTILIGWLSYRIHLYRKIKKRSHIAFQQLLSIDTIGNINLDLDRDL